MIMMIKDNVERIAGNETSAAKLQAKGYRILRGSSAAQAEEESHAKPLTDMNVNELRTYAKEQGVAGCGGLKKEEIIQLLTEGTGDASDGSGED